MVHEFFNGFQFRDLKMVKKMQMASVKVIHLIHQMSLSLLIVIEIIMSPAQIICWAMTLMIPTFMGDQESAIAFWILKRVNWISPVEPQGIRIFRAMKFVYLEKNYLQKSVSSWWSYWVFSSCFSWKISTM